MTSRWTRRVGQRDPFVLVWRIAIGVVTFAATVILTAAAWACVKG